jgi:hypothetical protein
MSYAFLSALSEFFVNEQHAMLTSPGSKSRPTFEELLRELRRATRKYHQKPQLSASHRIVSVSISVRTDVEFFLGPKSTIRHLIMSGRLELPSLYDFMCCVCTYDAKVLCVDFPSIITRGDSINLIDERARAADGPLTCSALSNIMMHAEDSSLEKSASILPKERRFKLSRYCF